MEYNYSRRKPPPLYYSDRSIPLVYWGGQPRKGEAILTVENYLKWCTLHAIHADGAVESVCCHEWLWDHLPHPGFCEALVAPREGGHTARFGYNWCGQSLEMLTGRWLLERGGVVPPLGPEYHAALRYLEQERPLRLQKAK